MCDEDEDVEDCAEVGGVDPERGGEGEGDGGGGEGDGVPEANVAEADCEPGEDGAEA